MLQCVLLAAGYATRLHPLTDDRPKALLPVGGRPILEHVLEKLVPLGLERIILVTNHRFADQFASWVDASGWVDMVTIADDGTQTNAERLGAIGDLAWAIEEFSLDDDTLVMAADNLFEFSLVDFVQFAQVRKTDCITVYRLDDVERLQRTGNAVLTADGRLTAFAEKPAQPISHWAVPPFYIYRRETLPLVRKYLAEGGNPDAPGHFLPWLLVQRPVYALVVKGNIYDVGTVESYREVQTIYGKQR